MFEHINYYYYDNNFFRLVCKDHSGIKLNQFNKDLRRMGFVSAPRPIKFLTSPFTFLEAIGIKYRSIQPPQFTIPSHLISDLDELIDELKLYLFQKALSYFRGVPELSRQKLLDAMNTQQIFGTPMGKDLFRRVFVEDFTKDRFEEHVYHHLAYDYVSKYKYPSNIENSVVGSFLLDIFKGPFSGWNISQARLLEFSWDAKVKSILLRNGKITEENCLKLKNDGYFFKANSDLVDTELIHLSVMGCLIGNRLAPVVCFTTDPLEKVKFRLWLYKQNVSFLARNFPKEAKSLNVSPGIVCVCSEKTGEIIEVIEVQKNIEGFSLFTSS